jgi:hypothetical protein
MENYTWLTTLPSMLIIALLGMISHFMKKQIKGETLTEITSYFKDHFKSTFIALVSTVISTFAYITTLKTGSVVDIIVVFQIGYMCDSAFNKWDSQEQKQ